MNQDCQQEDVTYWFFELNGNNIYNQKGDVFFGVIEDLMIDPNLLEVAAILTDQGKALKRLMQLITSIDLKVYGQNEILICSADGIGSLEGYPEAKNWLSVASHIIGSRVMTTAGEQLGVLGDVSIHESGRLAAYKLQGYNQSNQTGDEERLNVIPSITTHSIGSDQLIINSKDLEWIKG